jgi:hypothetical protein
MGALTEYLQDSFAEFCPPGWTCRREVPVLDGAMAELFGYMPKADVALERDDGQRKLWIEFEVSRADPVANHAKFATAHLFQPQRPTEAFISMVSGHVVRGRRNLAANTICLMRHIGMNAFHTTLLPNVEPDEIRRLNHLDKHALAGLNLQPQREIARAIEISQPVVTTREHRIYFVGDLLDVFCNLRHWNQQIRTDLGRHLWGRRRVRYFVFDRKTRQFAPSKFCAYLPLLLDGPRALPISAPAMTIELYASLDETEARFDGNRAWRHLNEHLAMNLISVTEDPELSAFFEEWSRGVAESIQVDGRGALILCSPKWFA